MQNYGFYWVIIYTFYLYYTFYFYISYIYYFTYPLCVFKRFYSKTSEASKLSKQYKKEYELTQEQKEALIGIMLADGFLFFFSNNFIEIMSKKKEKKVNLLIIQDLE